MNVKLNTIDGFTDSYNSFFPLMFSLVHSKVGNAHEAEDICQELFMTFYEKYDTIDNPRKWLYGAMRIVILKYYEGKKKDKTELEGLLEDVSMSYVNGFRDTRVILEEALEDSNSFKNEEERVLFELVAYYNFSLAKACRHLDMTYDKGRYTYDSVTKRLMDYLKKHGINQLEDLL